MRQILAKRVLSDDEKEWLRDHVADPLAVQAEHLGCHPDTVKRLHVDLGLRQYPGAKFQRRKPANWRRPCISCGCTKRRPRNHYLCKKCRQGLGYGS